MLAADVKDARSGSELVKIDKSNIMQLKLLNASILPIHYTPKFYQYVLQNPNCSRLAMWCGKYVGMVCCKVDSNILYIMTLGCLVLYRRKKIGTKLLNFVLDLSKAEKCSAVQLHVQSSNSDAVEFYEKFGFCVKDNIDNYYRYLKPTSALLLERLIVPSNSEQQVIVSSEDGGIDPTEEKLVELSSDK